MELSGKVFKVMPVESGEGKNGTWKKQQVIIEMESGKYPKKVAVVFWGDLVSSDSFVEGRDISVEFDIESREYNGKWYTDVKAWRINKTESGSVPRNVGSSGPAVAPAYTAADIPAEQVDDDLPF
ncbi:MAG: DUF3127 domain-containing protein [Chitinophagales bacterium]